MRLRKKTFSTLVKVLFFFLILFIGYRIVTRPRLAQKEIPVQEPASVKAKATTTVERSFKLPALTVGTKEEEEVTFTIVSAELKDEIKVQGTPKKATKDKIFLLLRLEIENETTKRLSLVPSDFIRLVDEEGKKFAPDFHNATIIVDPLSVRKDLVSFIVDGKARNFKLLVGELEEEKEEVLVGF